MYVLCMLLMLAADPSEAGVRAQNNFARPPAAASEKPDKQRRERDQRREEPPQEPPAAPKAKPAEEERVAPMSGPNVDAMSAFFGAELQGAEYGAVVTALSERLNRQVLTGVAPKDELDRFKGVSKGFARGRKESSQLIDRLYRNMISYLEVESEFHRKPTPKALRAAEEIVKEQVELDPNVPEERAGQIINIMETNGQFPPASIVFGVALRPFRPLKVPAGNVVLGLPTEPEYVDEEKRATATFDFMTCPGPICRVDFEAARVGELTVEQSINGKDYTNVEGWKSVAPGGIQGPMILERPVRARYLRITGAGETEPPMLRNVQVAALKGASAAIVAPASSTPEMDASFKEAAWPRKAEVLGFVATDGLGFAKQQTEIRLCRTSDTLYVAVYARDDRMKTLVAQQTERDAVLDGDESLEIQLRTGRGEPMRFAVNTAGVQFDAQGGDASWDGEWQVVTKAYPTGWAAEIAIPFATLGVRPQQGSTMQANFIRHRRNVINEDSAWSAGKSLFGTLAF
ncbi:MAG: hypothetical protein RBU21_08575 [FCB group bacterium]|nr:hypothetical protein [FCB group bacterium]